MLEKSEGGCEACIHHGKKDGFFTTNRVPVHLETKLSEIHPDGVTVTDKVGKSFKIEADSLFEEITDDADVLFLPGGLAGTNNLKAHEGLAEMLKAHAAAGKRLAAICAAPSILGELGLVKGHRATCYPGFETKMEGADCRGDGIITDRLISTGRGMGWAIDLGLELIKLLVSEEEAERIKAAIQYIK